MLPPTGKLLVSELDGDAVRSAVQDRCAARGEERREGAAGNGEVELRAGEHRSGVQGALRGEEKAGSAVAGAAGGTGMHQVDDERELTDDRRLLGGERRQRHAEHGTPPRLDVLGRRMVELDAVGTDHTGAARHGDQPQERFEDIAGDLLGDLLAGQQVRPQPCPEVAERVADQRTEGIEAEDRPDDRRPGQQRLVAAGRQCGDGALVDDAEQLQSFVEHRVPADIQHAEVLHQIDRQRLYRRRDGRRVRGGRTRGGGQVTREVSQRLDDSHQRPEGGRQLLQRIERDARAQGLDGSRERVHGLAQLGEVDAGRGPADLVEQGGQ